MKYGKWSSEWTDPECPPKVAHGRHHNSLHAHRPPSEHQVFLWSNKHISELPVSRMVTQGTTWKFVLLHYVIKGKCSLPIEFAVVLDTAALFLTLSSFFAVFRNVSHVIAFFRSVSHVIIFFRSVSQCFSRYRLLSQCFAAFLTLSLSFAVSLCHQHKGRVCLAGKVLPVKTDK